MLSICHRRSSSWFVVCLAFCVAPCAAQEASSPRVLAEIPRTIEELRSAFDAAEKFTAKPLKDGVPVTLHTLTPNAAEAAGIKATIVIGGKPLPVPMSRRSVLSLGTKLKPEDYQALPLLSAATIADHINRQYVCLQALVVRDLDNGGVKLDDRIVAAQIHYDSARFTAPFEPLVKSSLQETRSLGLYRSPGASRSEQPRTLVLVHRLSAEQYSGLFLHSRPIKGLTGDPDLELHVFATDEDGKHLLYFRPFELPKSTLDCDVVAAVAMSKYADDGLTPIAYEKKGMEHRPQSRFVIADLNAYAASQNWGDSYLVRLPDVLDAVIDKKVQAAAATK